MFQIPSSIHGWVLIIGYSILVIIYFLISCFLFDISDSYDYEVLHTVTEH